MRDGSFGRNTARWAKGTVPGELKEPSPVNDDGPKEPSPVNDDGPKEPSLMNESESAVTSPDSRRLIFS